MICDAGIFFFMHFFTKCYFVTDFFTNANYLQVLHLLLFHFLPKKEILVEKRFS